MENFPVLALLLFLSFSLACAEKEIVFTMNVEPPLANELSWTFYMTTCSKLDSIIDERVRFDLKEDVLQAAGLLCLHFHNCFVQGCDGSVLLDVSPNLTQDFERINGIIALAARDPATKRSVGTMDEMFKGRRLEEEDHKPPKPALDRGRDAQHD